MISGSWGAAPRISRRVCWRCGYDVGGGVPGVVKPLPFRCHGRNFRDGNRLMMIACGPARCLAPGRQRVWSFLARGRAVRRGGRCGPLAAVLTACGDDRPGRAFAIHLAHCHADRGAAHGPGNTRWSRPLSHLTFFDSGVSHLDTGPPLRCQSSELELAVLPAGAAAGTHLLSLALTNRGMGALPHIRGPHSTTPAGGGSGGP